MKSSVEEGLAPKRIATDKKLVGGEHLILGRAMVAGNARREGDMLDLWKDLAAKYKAGTL